MQHSRMSTHQALVGNVAEGKQLVLQVSSSGQAGQQAINLPGCFNIDIDVLSDEWRLYQLENIAESLTKDEHDSTRRVDYFWRDVLAIAGNDGITLKYPVLSVFVKSLLVVTHGNSDVERGFSDSGHSVTAERAALSEASINGLRSTRDGLKTL